MGFTGSAAGVAGFGVIGAVVGAFGTTGAACVLTLVVTGVDLDLNPMSPLEPGAGAFLRLAFSNSSDFCKSISCA